MLRLLIADDEKIIRESISRIIDWEKIGIELVAVCKDGMEAYDAILDEYPDIVLTDIRMPKLSGIELIQKIYQLDANIQFIIMSGYDDFEYAKQAMRCGVKHYILKPCNEQEITEAIVDASRDHKRAEQTRAYQLEIAQKNSQLHASLQNHIFLQALTSSQNNNANLESVYGQYVDFHYTPYLLCFMYYVEPPYADGCVSAVRACIAKNQFQCRFTFVYVRNTLIFFSPMPGAVPGSRDAADKDIQKMDQLFSSIDAGSKPGLCEYQRQLCQNLSELLTCLIPRIRRFESFRLYDAREGKPTEICNYTGIINQAKELMDQIFDSKEEEVTKKSLDTLKKMMTGIENEYLLQAVATSVLMRCRQSDDNPDHDISQLLTALGHLHSNEEICSLVFSKLDETALRHTGGSGKYKPFIQQLMQYCNEHLSDPSLSLKNISSNVLYMNVDYVSRQFLQQTGMKFSSYLNQLRIEKAKTLLLSVDQGKIHTVAEQVGCGNNPQYFSILFKKYTGMTPKNYIQKHSASDK